MKRTKVSKIPLNQLDTYRQFTQIHHNADECEHHKSNTNRRRFGQCRLATLNANARSKHSLRNYITHMTNHKIGILCITHAGGTEQETACMLNLARQNYQHYYIKHIPIPPLTETEIRSHKDPDHRAGGVLVIGTPEWAPQMGHLTTDSTKLGMLTQLTLHTLTKDVQIVIAYVPIRHSNPLEHPHSLHNQAQIHLDLEKQDTDPFSFITDTLNTWLTTARNKGYEIILLGDFNSHWTKKNITPDTKITSQHLQEWIGQFGLIYPTYEHRQDQHLHLPPTFIKNNSFTTPDHIFSSEDLDVYITGSGTCTCLGGDDLSDHHRTTWVNIDLPSSNIPKTPNYPQYLPIELDRNNPKHLQAISTRWLEDYPQDHKFPDTTDPHILSQELLHYLTHSVTLTTEVAPLTTQRNDDSWSPLVQAHQEHRKTLTEIKCRIDGTNNTRKWNEHRKKKELPIIIQNWTTRVKDLLKLQTPMYIRQVLNQTSINPQMLHEYAYKPITVSIIEDEIKLTKKNIRKAEIAARSDKIKEHIRRRNENFDLKKVSKCIKSVMGTGNRTTTLRTIKIEDTYTTDPEVIQEKLTAKNDDHFTLPVTSHPIAKLIQTDPILWQGILDGSKSLRDLPEAEGLPTDLLSLFEDAIRSTQNHDRLRQDMTEALSKPFLFDQFDKIINKKKKGKAPGITGCSINMMKQWPDHIRRRVFLILQELWTQKHIPDFWKNRWILPIPKTEETDNMDKLRPIALYEITRKIWTSMVLSRIHPILSTHKTLQGTQNGFVPHGGADTALLQLINAIEEAIESDTTLYYTAWDFKAAFDSPTKNLLRLSWTRLGIPPDIVEWLVQIEVGGKSYIKTPYAVYKAASHEFYMVSETDLAYFISACGVGQGDTQGPPAFLGVIDILLTMLNLAKAHDFYTRDDNERLSPQPAMVFADDSNTISSTLTQHQRQADIICMFSLITGLRIAPEKMFSAVWQSTSANTTEQTLMVRDSQWQEIPTTIHSNQIQKHKHLSVRCLGYYINIDNTSVEQEHQLEKKLIRGCNAILHSRASPSIKWASFKMALIQQLAYLAKLTRWPLKTLKNIDTTMNALTKRLALSMRQAPTALIHQPHSMVGLGVTPFSTTVNSYKWGMYLRATRTQHPSRQAAKALMGRAKRQMGNHSPPYVRTTLSTTATKHLKTWLGSVIEWAAGNNIALHHSGVVPNGVNSPIILHEPYAEESTWYDDRDICVYGDLRVLTKTTHGRNVTYECTIKPPSKPIRAAKASIQTVMDTLKDHLDAQLEGTPIQGQNILPQDMSDHNMIRRGQVWHTPGSKTAYEVLGRSSSNFDIIHWRQWVANGRHPIIREKAILAPLTTHDRGAGSDIQCSITALFPTPPKRIHYIMKEQILHNKKTPALVITHFSDDEQNSTVTPHDMTLPHWMGPISALIADHFQVDEVFLPTLKLSIYTDASHTPPPPGAHQIFNPSTWRDNQTDGKTTAAIVILDPTLPREEQEPLLIIINGINVDGHADSYTGEFTALNVANFINIALDTEWSIHSDCQVGVNLIHNTLAGDKSSYTSDTYHLLHHFLRYGIAPGTKITHVTGHPERTKPHKQGWTIDDFGIYIADLAAKHQWSKLTKALPSGYTTIHLEYKEIMKDITPIGEWILIDAEDEFPTTIKNIIKVQQTMEHETYLMERDNNRAEDTRSLPPKWTGSSFQLAGKIWSNISTNLRSRNRALKHVYDWTWHGMNEAKPSPIPLPCKQCNNPDGQAHMILHCPHPNMIAIRKETLQYLHDTTMEVIDKAEPYLGTAATIFERLIKDPPQDTEGVLSTDWDPERLWKGTWSDAQGVHFLHQLELESSYRQSKITHAQVRNIRNTIILLSTVLADGIRQMYAVRTQLNKQTTKSTVITTQPMQYKSSKRKKDKKAKKDRVHIPPHEIIPHHRTTPKEQRIQRMAGFPASQVGQQADNQPIHQKITKFFIVPPTLPSHKRKHGQRAPTPPILHNQRDIIRQIASDRSQSNKRKRSQSPPSLPPFPLAQDREEHREEAQSPDTQSTEPKRRKTTLTSNYHLRNIHHSPQKDPNSSDDEVVT